MLVPPSASDPKQTITGTNSGTQFEPKSGSQYSTELGTDICTVFPLIQRRIINGQCIRSAPLLKWGQTDKI